MLSPIFCGQAGEDAESALIEVSSDPEPARPDIIGQLSNLKELVLTGNLLTTLPDSIGDLSQLEVLNLSLNQIQRLPESISTLKSLRELHTGGPENTIFLNLQVLSPTLVEWLHCLWCSGCIITDNW